MTEPDQGMALLRLKRGTLSQVADAIGVRPQAVGQWQRVPVRYLMTVEKVTGIPRHLLRPDLYSGYERKRA